MRVRAWFFGCLGLVFAVAAIGWYELGKIGLTPIPPSIYDSSSQYPPSIDSSSLQALVRDLPKWYELERIRWIGLGLAAGSFFLAWRNSGAYTRQKYHTEIMAALNTLLLNSAQQAHQP